MSGRALALPATLVLLFMGCTSLTGDRGASEIAELKQQLNEQKKNATVGEIEVARLRAELARTKAALQEAEEELTRRRRDDTLKSDLPRERPKRPIDQTELEEPPPPPPPATAAPATAPTGGPAGNAPGEDPQALYDRGYTLFHQKSYDLAEATFRSFLSRFPDSDLADNALFWIGESHYAKGDFAAALEAFASTVARFPQGNKVADALLKAGRCLEQLGRAGEAARTYREVTERFPGSAAATGAQERLQALGPAPDKDHPNPSKSR